MWTLVPTTHLLKKRLLRWSPANLESVAKRVWQVAPGKTSVVPPAFFLPGQLDRIAGWEFLSEHPRRALEGGYTVDHEPTRAFLLEDALLIDGTLYCGDGCSYLQPRALRRPELHVGAEIERGAVYCTPGGNRYFGQWLLDDCVTYPLAAAEGTPITTAQIPSDHARAYEQLLGMQPSRCHSVRIRQAVVFRDVGQNDDKHRRFRQLGATLRRGLNTKPHPGVFMMRGLAGARRVLRNELEIAERLRDRFGLRILSPLELTVPELVAQCAGARLIAGVEGSALVHAALHLSPGGAMLVLQPPNRFVNVLKDVADRGGHPFAFVVGEADGADFSVRLEEVERTLELLPAVSDAPS